jgi:hypothetical protein
VGTAAQGGGRIRTALVVLLACGTLAGAALVGSAPASGAQRVREIAPGVEYRDFDLDAAHGVTHAHLVSVDLNNRHVRVGLLRPGAVASRVTVSRLADAQRALAGINGDFFDISEARHPKVEATGAAVGPEIAQGRVLKAAVPRGQRFGPALPPGSTTEDVLGVGTDGTARLDRLALSGSVTTPVGRWRLGGLNQYALPVGSIGVYTRDWGSASRARATCGTDTSRDAPCSRDTYEVTVRGGRVIATARKPGRGTIAAGTTVLVGRETGARQLRKLVKGEAVRVEHHVAAASGTAYAFAVGGFPVLRKGTPLSGLDRTASAVRTAVGIGNGGHRLLFLVLDGASRYRSGLTVAELASALRKLGATDGFNLDGGGSSTLVVRQRGRSTVSVLNHPSGGAERAVANGIGVFSAS